MQEVKPNTLVVSASVVSPGGLRRRIHHVKNAVFCSTAYVALPSGRLESLNRCWREFGDDISDLVSDIRKQLPEGWIVVHG